MAEPAIKQRAKASLTSHNGLLRRWFFNKYKLPITHPCYLDGTEAGWLEEMYADLYQEQAQAQYNLDHLAEAGLGAKAMGQERQRLMAELKRLSEALGESLPAGKDDSVMAKVEAQIVAGDQDVDMSLLLPKGFVARER